MSGPHRKATAPDHGGYPVSFAGDHGPRRASGQRHVTRTRRARGQAGRRIAGKAAR
jgi:hypothetical protein